MAIIQRRDPMGLTRSLWQIPTILDEDWFSGHDDVSVYETGDSVVVEANVAGVPEEHIHISVEGGTVTIRAEYEETDQQKPKKTAEYRTRRAAKYLYTVSIPTSVDSKSADAEIKHGILYLTLPKREEARPQQVKVRASSK